MNDPCLQLTLTALDGASTLWIVDENISVQTIGGLGQRPHLHAITNRYDIAESLRSRGVLTLLCDFDFDMLEGRQFSRIVYRVSKEKAVVHHCINRSLRHLTPTGEMWLIGGKQDGIKSIGKNAAATFGNKFRIKKEGVAYRVMLSPPEPGHADNSLPDNDYSQLRVVEHGGQSFFSKPGVFGWDKIDRGSALLVSVLDKVLRDMRSVSSVLDLGCGWGYLMLATKEQTIPRRVAVDNNMAALAAAAKNFAEAGLDVECVADDAGSSLRERFDLIVCNPPFHHGFAVSDTLTKHFLASAQRLSRRSTRAVFVVNQFIPLERLSGDYFGSCRELAEGHGFRVFELRPGVRHPYD